MGAGLSSVKRSSAVKVNDPESEVESEVESEFVFEFEAVELLTAIGSRIPPPGSSSKGASWSSLK